MAHSIDAASFEAYQKGWITSAGVLMPCAWLPEVIRWAKAHPKADLGIQLDLNAEWASNRWRPLSAQADSGLVDPAGYLPNDARYIAQHAKPEAIASEFRAQINSAKSAGLPVTHLDSHGGIAFYTPWFFREYWNAAADSSFPALLSKEHVQQRGRPTREPNMYDLAGVKIDISSVPIDRVIQMEPGVAQRDWLSAYERTLAALPPGTYLLSVHLGFDDEELKAMTVDHPNWGAQWRQNDYDVISSPAFHKFLTDKGFVLIGWKELEKRVADRLKVAPAK